MKKLNFLFLGLLSFMPIWGCNDDDSLPEAVVEVKEGHNEDIVSVIDYDIKNDGTLIGSQLNNLVGQSYGKTLYFYLDGMLIIEYSYCCACTAY